MTLPIIQPTDSPEGLGSVPALGGDITTAVPNPATGVSPTQVQQSATTGTQAAAQAIVLPPPPYAVLTRLDPSGSLATWFQALNRKLGGYTAPSTADLDVWTEFDDLPVPPRIPDSLDWPDSTVRPNPDALDWPDPHTHPQLGPNQTINAKGATHTFGNGNTNATLILNGAAGTLRNIVAQTNGVNRWVLGFNSTGETGSDAGTDFILSARTDAGVAIDTPITIIRAAGGAMTLSRPVAHSSTCGFNGTAPITKPTVTGSRAANAALASLLTALAGYGLVTDSTTA